jgi:hypothetical protein
MVIAADVGGADRFASRGVGALETLSLVESFGMHNFHQAMVIPIIDGYADDHRPLHREGLLEGRRDLVWMFDPQSIRAERFGKADYVDRS